VDGRWDDNVYRATAPVSLLTDFVYSLEGGGQLSASWPDWRVSLDYRLGADLYQEYENLDNLKNELGLLLSFHTGDWAFTYRNENFLRNSSYSEFAYFDDDNLFSIGWVPPGTWSSQIHLRSFYRQYSDNSASFQARNFTDQGGVLEVRREVDDRLSLAWGGGYNNRLFNRYAVGQSGGSFVNLASLQSDETWSVLLRAHYYLFSILQDINLDANRTDSNSYGFSNSVQSASWAAVVSPAENFFLQLFFRLYAKTYDITPITNNNNLLVGFTDEDSQDLLSIKATWEYTPDWTFSLGLSRLRNESNQPGLYYIKNLISAQVQRKF